MLESWTRRLRDAGDILRHARNPAELAKALMPNQWLSRKVLNETVPVAGAATPDGAARALRKLRDQLKTEIIDDRGHVDYERLHSSLTFMELRKTSGLLRRVRPEQIGHDDERIAFWINVYNVLAIHGVVALGIRASVMEIPSFFGVVAYRIGSFVLTLDDIENGILRRNAPHPATGTRLFDDEDGRLGLCPSHVDPRIHAALVCASTSCPPVAFYEASNLDAQLELAADHYVAAGVEVDDAAKVVRLPITFRYFQSDFGRLAGLRLFLLGHSHDAHHEALQGAFDAGYELDYHRYDWSLNSVV